MPSQKRERSAAAAVDVELSDRAATRGVSVRPERIRRWRLAGLLPRPGSVGSRPEGSPPGKLPSRYDPLELSHVDRIVDALARHAKPGRPADHLALLLFAEGVPTDTQVVIAAVDNRLALARDYVAQLVDEAQQTYPAPPGLALDPRFDRADAVAQLAVGRHPRALQSIRLNLQRAGRPRGKSDLVQLLTRFLVSVQDDEMDIAPDEDGEAGPEDQMIALGLEGMLASAAPDVSPLLSDASDFVVAAAFALRSVLLPLPADLKQTEIENARDFVIDLSAAFHAVPDSQVLHYLGGPAVHDLWNPADPWTIASTMSLLVRLQQEVGRLDASPIVGAVRDLGWLEDV